GPAAPGPAGGALPGARLRRPRRQRRRRGRPLPARPPRRPGQPLPRHPLPVGPARTQLRAARRDSDAGGHFPGVVPEPRAYRALSTRLTVQKCGSRTVPRAPFSSLSRSCPIIEGEKESAVSQVLVNEEFVKSIPDVRGL